jgi:hypothetical protein
MWLIGTVYNFCRAHRSLRLAAGSGAAERRWIERTPALKRRDSPISAGRFTSCLSSLFPRLLYPSGAGDDRDGCWRLLMRLDYSPRLNEVLPCPLAIRRIQSSKPAFREVSPVAICASGREVGSGKHDVHRSGEAGQRSRLQRLAWHGAADETVPILGWFGVTLDGSLVEVHEPDLRYPRAGVQW